MQFKTVLYELDVHYPINYNKSLEDTIDKTKYNEFNFLYEIKE